MKMLPEKQILYIFFLNRTVKQLYIWDLCICVCVCVYVMCVDVCICVCVQTLLLSMSNLSIPCAYTH